MAKRLYDKYKVLILGLLAGIFLSACDKEEKPKKTDPQVASTTVIMYMAAENSMSSYVYDDLREVLAAKQDIPLDANFIVYVDDKQMPRILVFSAMGGEEEKYTLPEGDSCDSLTFRNNLSMILRDYPAEHYGLIMWSHASGWIPEYGNTTGQIKTRRKAFGIDNHVNTSLNTGTELEIPSMKRMLEQLNVHWDYILFDACFMQCIEVDYELRNLTDYVIASPAEAPADGAPYNRIMRHLFNPKEAAKKICEEYYNYYHKTSDAGLELGKGLVISAVKTAELEGLAMQTREFVKQLFSERRQYSMEGVQIYCPFVYNSYWKPEFYDFASVMYNLLESPVSYNEWWLQMQKCLEACYHSNFWDSIFDNYFTPRILDHDHTAAVSIFIPHEKYEKQGYNAYLNQYEWYTAAGWNETGW